MENQNWQGPAVQLELPLVFAKRRKPKKARKLSTSPAKKSQSVMADMAENHYYTTDQVLYLLGFSRDKDKKAYLAMRKALYEARSNEQVFRYGLQWVIGSKKPDGKYKKDRWLMSEQRTIN